MSPKKPGARKMPSPEQSRDRLYLKLATADDDPLMVSRYNAVGDVMWRMRSGLIIATWTDPSNERWTQLSEAWGRGLMTATSSNSTSPSAASGETASPRSELNSDQWAVIDQIDEASDVLREAAVESYWLGERRWFEPLAALIRLIEANDTDAWRAWDAWRANVAQNG
jgi:hypothetical protein